MNFLRTRLLARSNDDDEEGDKRILYAVQDIWCHLHQTALTELTRREDVHYVTRLQNNKVLVLRNDLYLIQIFYKTLGNDTYIKFLYSIRNGFLSVSSSTLFHIPNKAKKYSCIWTKGPLNYWLQINKTTAGWLANVFAGPDTSYLVFWTHSG